MPVDDVPHEDGSPLPRSRAALAHARRVLDQLPTKEDSRQAYTDDIGWVLDRLDNVWRTISEESKGSRTQAFGTWWATQHSGNREAMKTLRNAEVKRGQQSTRQVQIFIAGSITVHEDGSITQHDNEGNDVEGFHVTEAHLTDTRWHFAVPGLDDERSVQEVLEIVYKGLENKTLPMAERLMLVEQAGP